MSDSEHSVRADLERRLATILSADVAEYSRLMAEDEEQTLRVFRGHKEVFEKLVALHRGRVFNTAGDAILAEFGSAVEAVRCATEIQAALRTRNDQLSENRQVQFRIGVNLGDVMVQEGDLLGDGVNVAARLQSAAAPGGVCISGSVYDQIRNRLSLSFKPLGEMNFKNIPQAVRTFSIIEAEGLGELPAPPAALQTRRRLGLPVGLAIAALVLLLVGGGAFWAYSAYQQREAAIVRAAKRAAEKRAQEAVARVEAEHQKAAAVQPAAPAATPPQPVPSPPVAAAAADGVYAGPICFGATQTLAARCFPARATLQQGRISGQWPGRDGDVTMHLEGDVSTSGHVTLQMHGEKTDGTRVALAELEGTLRDSRLDATGAFANGRSATLNWRRSEEGQSPAPPAAEAAAPPPVAAVAPVKPAPLPQPASLATAGVDGVYAGPICFGPGPAQSARCFRASASLQQGKLTGQWPGRDPGVTMHLDGEVSPAGQATIHMHAERPNGSRLATINLAGTLRDGKLDATGAFLNGRSASLNWRKD